LSMLLFLTGEAVACQLTMPARLAAFDDSLFVLTGTVQEIVGPIVSDNVTGEAFALRVRVTENLHSPQPGAAVVDVFQYNLGAGCDAIGMSRSDLAVRFPPGTAVRVVARAARKVPPARSGAPLRLEAGPYNAHALVTPIYPEEPLSASLAGVYDFAVAIDVDRFERIDARRFDWLWYDGVVQFEAIKEVLRLERAGTEAERVAILDRAQHNPATRTLDFAGLVRRFVEDPAVAARLIGPP